MNPIDMELPDGGVIPPDVEAAVAGDAFKGIATRKVTGAFNKERSK